jgi:hypothetical protein
MIASTAETCTNNSIQSFIIYVTSQPLQGQLQTQHSVDTGNYIKGKHNMKKTATYNSIQFIYLRADSTAIGLLQSQHGHIQQNSRQH